VPPPPVPLMSITVQPASGKPRVIVMDEAGLTQLIMDAADALAAMAAASAVLAPAGEHPYPEPLPRRQPLACPAVSPDGDRCAEPRGHSGHHYGPDDDGVRRMWPDSEATFGSLAAAQDAALARAGAASGRLAAELAPCPSMAWGTDCLRLAGHPVPHRNGDGRTWTGECPAEGCLLDEQHDGGHDFGEPHPDDLEDAAAQDENEADDPFMRGPTGDDEIITAPADPGWRDERTGLMSGPTYKHVNRLSCGCTFAGPLTWPAGRKARCDSHGEVTTVDTDPSGGGGEPPAPAELTEDEARQPCDRKACGHERGHHAKGTEECAHGCGCAAYLLPMPAPAGDAETEDAP
jgi:hypothetical protein